MDMDNLIKTITSLRNYLVYPVICPPAKKKVFPCNFYVVVLFISFDILRMRSLSSSLYSTLLMTGDRHTTLQLKDSTGQNASEVKITSGKTCLYGTVMPQGMIAWLL